MALTGCVVSQLGYDTNDYVSETHSRNAHFELFPDVADIAITHEFETTPESMT